MYYPNIYIHAFRERFGFIWGCVFPVSDLNENLISFAIRKTVYTDYPVYLQTFKGVF